MGRKRLYTDEQIVAALVAMKGMVYLAAERVGCNPDTIYTRAEKSKAIKDAIRNERGKVLDTAELKLYQAILNSEPWAIRMVLMTLGKARGYVERDPELPPLEVLLAALPVAVAQTVRAALAQALHAGRDKRGGDVGPESVE